MTGESLLSALWPVLLILGTYGLARALWVRRLATRAEMWPTTDGKIEHSAVRKGRTGSAMSSSGKTTFVTTYEARITYRYKLGQQRFQGSRMQFGAPRRFYKRSEAEHWVKEYP